MIHFPKYLKDDLKLEELKAVHDKFPVLSQNFSKSSVESIIMAMTEENYLPNQVIFRVNQY